MGVCASSGGGSGLSPYLLQTAFSVRLSPKDLEEFARHFQLKRFSAGATIFDQNDPVTTVIGSDFYVLIEGGVDFYHDSAYFCSKSEGDAFPDPILDADQARMSTVAPNSLDGADKKEHSLSTSPTDTSKMRRRSTRTSNVDTLGVNFGLDDRHFDKEREFNYIRSIRGRRPSRDDPLNGVRRRIATCTARENCTVMVLQYTELSLFLRSHPHCRAAVLPLLSDPSQSLSNLSFFKGINQKKLVLLGMMLKFVALRPSEVLFEEGSVGNSLFIVIEGVVKATAKLPITSASSSGSHDDDKEGKESKDILSTPSRGTQKSPSVSQPPPAGEVKTAPDGSQYIERELKQFVANDIFGEIAVIMDIPRTASITCLQSCLLLELQRDSFQKFLKLVPHTVNLHNIMKMRTAEHFRKYKVPFFEAIPDDKYQNLASLCKIGQIPPNTIVFKEGDIGNEFFIIAYGEVKVTVAQKDATGKVVGERELTRMGPGKYFGEIALVQDTPRTATVSSTSRCVILSITKENFQRFFNEAPEAIADFEVKLARYDVQLRSVIYHQLGLEFFTQHLKREYSEENIEFWKACRDFRHLPETIVNEEKEKEKAKAEQKRHADDRDFNVDEVKSEIENIQQLQSELRDRTVNDPHYVETAKENIKSMFEVFKVKSGGGGGGGSNDYQINLMEFEDIFSILNISLTPKEFESLCSSLNFQRNSRISFDVFYASIQRFTDGTFIGQIVVSAHSLLAQMAKKKGTKSPKSEEVSQLSTISSCRVMLNLEKSIIANRLVNLREVFNHCDKDGSGDIDYSEFSLVMKNLQVQLANEQLQAAFNAIDENQSGTISFPEFVAYHVYERQQAEKVSTRLRAAAMKIYEQFIGDSATKQVNIKGPTQLQITSDVKSNNFTVHLFDRAEEEILKLMSSDSFARFKQSELFQQFLDQADSYKHVEAGNRERDAYIAAQKDLAAKLAGETKTADGATDPNNPRRFSRQTSPFGGGGFQPKLRKSSFSGKKSNAAIPIETNAISVQLDSPPIKGRVSDATSPSNGSKAAK